MRRRAACLVLSTAVAGAALLCSVSAVAYSYHHTEDGDPVRWTDWPIEVGLDESLERLGDPEDVRAAIQYAFAIWTEDASLPLEFVFVEKECGEEADGNSCVLASYAPEPGDEADATTFTRVSSSSGEIVEADIVFFETAGPWSTEGEEPSLDLLAVAAHEVGHFIGMGHSEVEAARMYPSLLFGETWDPVLDEDDIRGATALYEGVRLCNEVAGPSCSASIGSGRPGSVRSILTALFSII